MQVLAASCEPVFAMTGKEALGAVYMSPPNRASPGNLLKENLILTMKDHRNDIGKFS